MKLIIDIDEETYKMCKRLLGDADGIERAIADGIPFEETSCGVTEQIEKTVIEHDGDEDYECLIAVNNDGGIE